MKTPNIIHVLANGEQVKSIEGVTIPNNNSVYEVILKGVRYGRNRDSDITNRY